MNIKEIVNLVEKFNTEIIIGLIIGVLVLLLINLISQIRISSIRKKYNKVVEGSEGLNLEELLIDINSEMDGLKDRLELFQGDLRTVNEKLSYSIQKKGMVRYNALEDLGSNQSYSIALLDQYNNGFILTSLYGRDFNASYLKPVTEGRAEYKLSSEEEMALNQAIKN